MGRFLPVSVTCLVEAIDEEVEKIASGFEFGGSVLVHVESSNSDVSVLGAEALPKMSSNSFWNAKSI